MDEKKLRTATITLESYKLEIIEKLLEKELMAMVREGRKSFCDDYHKDTLMEFYRQITRCVDIIKEGYKEEEAVELLAKKLKEMYGCEVPIITA
jgi:hypothetical protein